METTGEPEETRTDTRPQVPWPVPGKRPPAEAPPPEPEPAEFPRGFWPSVDYILRYPNGLAEALKSEERAARISVSLAFVSAVMAAIYGAVMGATNLLQGSTLPIEEKLMMIAVSSIKTPVLFLLTLCVVLPPVYVSNAFAGARLEFRRMTGLLLVATAVGTTLLASMASVAFFFALTSRSYDFIKILHVVFFAYAGAGGLAYFARILASTSPPGRRASYRLMALWFFLYMFVGTQLAWVLRPFVASPGEPFQLFRERSGNFYESVAHSLGRMTGH